MTRDLADVVASLDSAATVEDLLLNEGYRDSEEISSLATVAARQTDPSLIEQILNNWDSSADGKTNRGTTVTSQTAEGWTVKSSGNPIQGSSSGATRSDSVLNPPSQAFPEGQVYDSSSPSSLATVSEFSVENCNRNPNNLTTLRGAYHNYLESRKNKSPTTRAQYKRTLPPFIDFATNHGVTKVAEIAPELISQYVLRLKSQSDSDATVFTHTKNLRAWLNRLERWGKCQREVLAPLHTDELDLSPQARDEAIGADEMEHILRQLRTKRFGTPQHVYFEVLCNVGQRNGGGHSLDLEDYDKEKSKLEFCHQPEQGTRLKNGNEEGRGNGQRPVTISSHVVEAIDYYIERERHAVVDDFGRAPLFTTKYGRASKSTLRRWIYQATSCRWSPSDDDIYCDGSCNPDSNVCPYSYCPHAIRRGSIVESLRRGMRLEDASERFDVSIPILKKHYDPRTGETKREDREGRVRDSWIDI